MTEKKLFSKKSIIIAIIVVAVLWIGGAYNSLVKLDENTKAAFANVEAQLQRRFDLIPNLQSIVEGAANFEKSTFVEVTQARTQWLNASSIDQKIAAANQMEGALARLLVTLENYPQLQATQGFRDFQVQLEGTENRIATERIRYNKVATEYNKRVRTFPSSLIAKLFGFHRHELFKAEKEAEKAPKIDFSFSAPQQ